MQKRLTREEVPDELIWELTDLFESLEAWESELEGIQNDLHTFT